MKNNLLKAKEEYVNPEVTTVVISSQRAILDVSKPGGNVNPLDPDEG